MKSCLTFSLLLLSIHFIETIYSDTNCIALTEKTRLSDAKPIILNISVQNSNGFITSPDYTDNPLARYPLETICAWNIVAPIGKQIEITFDDFDLQLCPFDVLQVREGLDTNASLIASLCGNTNPTPIISKGNALNLIFISDERISYRGFRLSYRLHEPESECKSNQFKCRNKKCVSKLKLCNRYDDCRDGSDEENCRHRLYKWRPKCGIPKIKPILGNGERIVGGQTAIRGSWPWMASLRVHSDRHSCGAVLINHEWVVSAAHCFLFERNTSAYTLYFGKYFKEKYESTESIRYSKKIIIHHNYLPFYDKQFANRKEYDIALVKLNAPVFFNDPFRLPICLPKHYQDRKMKEGKLCQVTGWGYSLDIESADRLKQVEVPVVSPDKCIKSYKNIFVIDPKVMICAGYSDGGHDSCAGDSGGPLAYRIGQKWYLMGIVSSGGVNGCGQPGMPGIYTRIGPLLKWIHNTIKQN